MVDVKVQIVSLGLVKLRDWKCHLRGPIAIHMKQDSGKKCCINSHDARETGSNERLLFKLITNTHIGWR